jgi:predicted RNA-binding protein with PIN domain
MCNYQGYTKKNVIVVFDAYKVQGGQGSEFDYHNIHVVYTKEAQTADQYIEKFTNKHAKTYNITVATSDRLEQMIIWGQGARRLSARGLLEEVQSVENAIREKINWSNEYLIYIHKGRTYLYGKI